MHTLTLAIADALCTASARCAESTSAANLDACRASSAGTLTNAWEPLVAAAISRGGIAYRPPDDDACVAAMAHLDCATFVGDPTIPGVHFRVPAVCRNALAGTVELGGACHLDLECTGDRFCDTAIQCPGTCTAPSAEHQHCLHLSAADCQGDLECTEHSYTCEQPAGTGAACTDAFACPGLLRCDGVTHACAPAAELATAPPASPCDTQLGPYCAPGLSCAAAPGSTCTAIAREGEPCLAGTPEPCSPGAICDAPSGSTQGVCARLPVRGEACALMEWRCASGLNCDYDLDTAVSVCAEVQANGGPCVNAGDCYSSQCNAGACRPPACQIVP